MRRSLGPPILRLLGSLCAASGLLAWIGLAWRAISDLDLVTPQSEEGNNLVAWGLTGTVLMITGMVLLHVAALASERDERPDSGSSPRS